MKVDLSDRDMYAIVTALRGPDTEDELGLLVKEVFTIWLRYWMGLSGRPIGIKEEQIRGICELYPSYFPWWSHWAAHMRLALQVLPKVISEAAEEIKNLRLLLVNIRLMQVDDIVKWAKRCRLIEER